MESELQANPTFKKFIYGLLMLPKIFRSVLCRLDSVARHVSERMDSMKLSAFNSGFPEPIIC